MSKKWVLAPYPILENQSMAASFQSGPVSLEYFDRCNIAILTSGTPTGQITIQASEDYLPPQSAPATLVPTWFDIPLNLAPLTGTPNNYIIDIIETSIRYIRIDYVAAAGVGTMNAKLSAKDS